MEDLIPFQVQLERRQHARLKALAESRRRSMGSMIRESVAAYLADIPVEDDPAYAIIGCLGEDDGPLLYGDVGVNHDAYLADIYEAEGQKPPP